MSFLRAEWRKLAMANYEVDPKIILPHVPAGTEPDLWNGKCYLSLVGFLFKDTRLKGVKIPFHINFEEVNLRFYVKRITDEGERRGVVFIREIVSKPALTFVANTVYGEHYTTMPMRYHWDLTQGTLEVSYSWRKKGRWNSMLVKAENNAQPILPGSEEEFITEHYWGYAAINDRKTNEYEVTHPRWEHYPVIDHTIDVAFGDCYGPEFDFLSSRKPDSVLLAEGSVITVESKKTLTS